MRAWTNIYAVGKRELISLFTSPIAYIVIGIFLLLNGFFTFRVVRFFAAGEATLAGFFVWQPIIFLVLVSAIGMRLWSEERRMGTMELLLTMPITAWQAIIGKFLASWLFLALALALTLPMVFTVSYLGDPDPGPIFCGYFGSFLLSGSYLAIASLTSAITRNQVISFILSLVICLFLVLSGWPEVNGFFAKWPAIAEAISGVSSLTHFNSFQRGVIDFRDILYFASIILFSLFATSVVIRMHRTAA